MASVLDLTNFGLRSMRYHLKFTHPDDDSARHN
jgi:hypothetical protein